MNYEELLAQKREIERQAALIEGQLKEARKATQSAVVAQIKSLMVEHGLSASDLQAPSNKGAVKRVVPPKFVHPTSGQTWSGRGIMPRWLKAEVDGGKSVDEFKI